LDRVLATQLGAFAVDALLKGECGMLAGVINGRETLTPLADIAGRTKSVDKSLVELANRLAGESRQISVA
jgi:6-phosphofructokinase 1